MKTILVVATRASVAEFWTETATGRSVAFNRPPGLSVHLFANNKLGLPSVYNQAIRACIGKPAILVFAHDDLHFLDFFWCNQIAEGLTQFDILGIAGNKRRLPKQSSWAFVDQSLTWDARENLSGVVGHGNGYPPKNLSRFGPSRQRVKLLDGLLLAAKSETLISNDIYFDEIFDFHFYDLDICRQAELKSLTCGTWELSIIHESGGRFGTAGWRNGYKRYLDKWKE
jgi:hypothetical protein